MMVDLSEVKFVEETNVTVGDSGRRTTAPKTVWR